MALSGVTDLVGRVLSDRYRLVSPIGSGGGGRVYVADDSRLRRRVAVKVLHAALADDAGFLRRFRAEAQLAASLHHPNVMAVYDWGEDGVPFIVLELLTGGSLRGALDRGMRLTPSQAVVIGRQVTSALAYAHTRGVVHRDIKPGNLLFDEHAVVRVGDFGLARAFAEASWTEPAGAVLGTARYAAPEQGSGGPLDGRADLYALALVLIEAITGRVPGVADTPVGTLAGRAQTPLVAPEELGGLGPVVERAGRPSPSERYPDAATMGDALGDAARRLPPPGPLALPGLGSGEDPDPTRLRGMTAVFDQDAQTLVTEPASEVSAAFEAHAPRRSVRRAVPFVVAGLLVVVFALAIFLFTREGGGTVSAPALVGLDQQAAAARASQAGVLLAVERQTSDDPAGIVIRQTPPGGNWMASGGKVHVVVSRGPPPVAVPEVAGKPEAEATLVLSAAGFAVSPERRTDENVPKGAVVATEPPANAKQSPDTTVRLIVSDGPAPVPVPDVHGKSYDEAAAALSDLRLSAARRDEFSDTVEPGKVIGTDPPAGLLVAKGTAVTVRVSKGPELVPVPSVKGAAVEAATQQLAAAGLQVDVQNFAPGRKVRAQDPDAGASVPKGTKVTLFL